MGQRPTPKAIPMTHRRSLTGSWPILLALALLGLFWFLYGLVGAVQVYRVAGMAAQYPAVLLASLPSIALFTGFGLAHLVAAYGLWVRRGWAIVLAAVVAVLGLTVLGLAARWVMATTADAVGQFDIGMLSVWRFHGWEVIGIFGLFVLADVVILVAVAREILERLRTPVAGDNGSA